MKENKGKASFIMGVLGICLCWLIPFASIILGIIGLCMNKGRTKNIILNILSIVLGIMFWIFWTLVNYYTLLYEIL